MTLEEAAKILRDDRWMTDIERAVVTLWNDAALRVEALSVEVADLRNDAREFIRKVDVCEMHDGLRKSQIARLEADMKRLRPQR